MTSLQHDGCPVGHGKDGGRAGLDAPQRRRWLQFTPNTLERVLHASFFLLGMGLMAPITAILQTMDYLNIFFAQFYPSRTLYTAYNTCNLIALVILFKWGDRLWPNKRSRMVVGYSLYTVILMALPLMDFIIIDHGHNLPPRKAMELAFTVWAVGSCIAGFSDAFISTVAYSQAASIGQRYTHAFVGGRATSGLVMAALRCISKGALRQNLAGLRQSTSIYVMIAALIVLSSCLVAGLLLPRLAPQIEALHKPAAHADATHGKCSHCRARQQQRQLEQKLSTGGHAPSRPMGRDDSALITGALPIPPPCPPECRLSTWGSFSPLLPSQSGALAHATEQQQQHGHQHHQHHAAARSRHSVWGSNKLSQETSHDLKELKHKQGLAQVLDAALPTSAEKSADSATSHASGSSALIPHSKQQFSIAEESSEGGSQPPSPPSSSSPGSDLGLRAGPPALNRSSSQPSTPCIDADVVVLTGGKPLAHGDSPTAKDQHMVVYLQSYVNAANSVASELSTDSEVCCTCHHHSKDVSSDASSDSDSGDSHASSAIGDSWWALLKIVWPFCLAVQPAPMTTATILPLNLSSQVANWPVATAARWHVQIMMVTVQLGFFLGSAVIPIKTPRRPRVSLLVMACAMFLFAPIFAAALIVHAPPYAFLILALTMHTYSGYMTSTVFCVASQGFESKVAVRVQQLLVLSMGVSYVVGSCVSWIWVFIGRP